MKEIASIAGALLLWILFVGPFMLLFWWLRRSAAKFHPREEGASIKFPIARPMLVLLWTVVGLLVAFTALVVVEAGHKGEGLYATLIPLSVLVAILATMPRVVVTDHGGIHQRLWLREERFISWGKVAWMRRGNSGATDVKSQNGGRPISFSPLLVGQSRFEQEVRRHTRGLDVGGG